MKFRYLIQGLLFLFLVNTCGEVSAFWEPPVVVSDPALPAASADLGPVLSVTAEGNATAVWTVQADDEFNDPFSIWSSAYTRGIGWSAPVMISSTALNSFGRPLYTSQGDPDMEMNSSGYAVAVWEGEYSDLIEDPRMVFSSTRTNGVWGPVEFVSTFYGVENSEYPASINVALNEAGTALAAWNVEDDNNGNAYVRISFKPFGGAWTPQLTISDPNQDANGIQDDRKPYVVINERGDAAVIWFGRFPPNERRIQVATYNSLTATWSAPITLDTGDSDTFNQNPRIAIDEAGNAVAIWNALNEVRTAYYTFGAGWTGFQTLATDADELSSDIVMDPAGNATAVWQNQNGQIVSSFRPANGPWGTPEVISTGTGNAFTASASLEPLAVDRNGNVIVIWSLDDFIFTAFHPFGLPWQSQEEIDGSNSEDTLSIGLANCGFAVALWQLGTETLDLVYAAVNANLLSPQSASFINGCRIRFATQSRYTSVISWVPVSPACIRSYRIYCNGVLVGESTSSTVFEFVAPRCDRLDTCTYTITSVNIYGFESEPVPVTFIN